MSTPSSPRSSRCSRRWPRTATWTISSTPNCTARRCRRQDVPRNDAHEPAVERLQVHARRWHHSRRPAAWRRVFSPFGPRFRHRYSAGPAGVHLRRFYQVNESHAGSGIGLSIVRRIVELHEGSITLRSDRGFSEFTTTLPDDSRPTRPGSAAGEHDVAAC